MSDWPAEPTNPARVRRCHSCGLIGTVKEIVARGCDRAPCFIDETYPELAAAVARPREIRAAPPTAPVVEEEQTSLLPMCRRCTEPVDPKTIPQKGVRRGNRYSNLCPAHLEEAVQDWRDAMTRARAAREGALA